MKTTAIITCFYISPFWFFVATKTTIYYTVKEKKILEAQVEALCEIKLQREPQQKNPVFFHSMNNPTEKPAAEPALAQAIKKSKKKKKAKKLTPKQKALVLYWDSPLFYYIKPFNLLFPKGKAWKIRWDFVKGSRTK